MQINRQPARERMLPKSLFEVLPQSVIEAIEGCGCFTPEEIRLSVDRTVRVRACGRTYSTELTLDEREIQALLQKMCGGSLYAHRASICQGYLSLSDGVRVGIAGSAAVEDGRVIGVSAPTSLVIRIPHAVRVDAAPVIDRLRSHRGQGVLLYAPPGVGKTTLLRAVACAASGAEGIHTVVVDTREELQYTLHGRDLFLEILAGYPKELGIEIALRSLGAELILCDEIGSRADADAILSAAGCGVPLVASAHARDIGELLARETLRDLHRARVFGSYIGLRREGNAFQYRCSSWNEAEQLCK